MSEIVFDHALFSAEVKKHFGDEAIRDLESAPAFGDPGTFVPTSSEQLNIALGIGGFPLGRIIEIYGLESSGKSTLALDVAAQMQKMFPKRPVFYADVENALNPEYAAKLGVDLSKKRFIVTQEVETEMVLNLAYKAASAGACAIIVDSIAGLTLKSDMEDDDTTGARVGGNSKAIRAHLRRMNEILPQTKAVALYLNHITYKPGVVYGSPETTPGGRGLPFFATQRLDVRQGQKILDKSGERIGHKMNVKVVKNKVATPYRNCEIDLTYGQGFDRVGDLTDAAVAVGVVEKGGAWLNFGKSKFNGRDKMIEALKADAKLEQALRDTLHGTFTKAA